MGTILVADDDRDIRELVSFKLTQAGHQVHTTDDGRKALDSIMNDCPDLAILDVMMPGLSGVDVIRQVRADAEIRGLRIILLTARAQEGDVQAGFSVGADDYVDKPFSPRALMSRVTALLARGQP